MRNDHKCMCYPRNSEGFFVPISVAGMLQVVYFVDAGNSHWDLLWTLQKYMGLAWQIADPETFPFLSFCIPKDRGQLPLKSVPSCGVSRLSAPVASPEVMTSFCCFLQGACSLLVKVQTPTTIIFVAWMFECYFTWFYMSHTRVKMLIGKKMLQIMWIK